MEIHQSSPPSFEGVESLNGLTGDVVLAAGSNISLTILGNTITIAAIGGLVLLTPTGDVNGVNTEFVFPSKPIYIVSDGAWYRENVGWTWDGGTMTATMIIPPNDDIWGFS